MTGERGGEREDVRGRGGRSGGRDGGERHKMDERRQLRGVRD